MGYTGTIRILHFSSTQLKPTTKGLTLVQLLQLGRPLVQRTINSSGDSESAANDGAHADKEARERLGAGFTVDNLHRGDVLCVQ